MDIGFVGRESEMQDLLDISQEVQEGKGRTVLLVGEAGIGKTRLSSELEQLLNVQGFQLMRGQCLPDSLAPLLPFRQALREAGMANLLSDSAPPNVLWIYLMTDTGLLVADYGKTVDGFDSDIFAGMLSAVESFVKDSLSMLETSTYGRLQSMEYGGHKFVMEQEGNLNLVAIIKGNENEFLRQDMRNILDDVARDFGPVLDKWNGNLSGLGPVADIIGRLITSGKYEGIDYAVDDANIKMENIFDNVLMGLSRMGKDKPQMLTIDDLHWTEPSTLALFHYISRNIKDQRVLLIGSLRPEDASEGLDSSVKLMSREGLIKEVRLSRLSDTTSLLKAMLGKFRLEDDIIEHLGHETDGNPFFLQELVQLLKEEKHLQQGMDDVWHLTIPLDEIHMPERVYDVITRRVNRLDQDLKDILECASVIGESFDSKTLGQALQLNRIRLLKSLDELEKKHKLIKHLEKGYRFDHAKIREVLYNDIPGELRQEFHSLIAETLLPHIDEGVMLDKVAHHFFEAGHDQAVEFAIKAAEANLASYGNEEAIEWFKKALSRMDENDPRKPDILTKLSTPSLLSGRWREGMEFGLQLVEIGTRMQDKQMVALAQYNIGEFYDFTNMYEEGVDILESSFEGFKDIDDKKGMAKSLCGLGRFFWKKGQIQEAIEKLEQGLELAEQVGDLSLMGRLYDDLGNAYGDAGDYKLSIKHYKRSIELLSKTSNKMELARAYNNIGDIYLRLNEYHTALGYFEKQIDIGELIGYELLKTHGYFNAADALANMGGERELEIALEYCQKAMEAARKLGNDTLLSATLCAFGITYTKTKEWEMAEDYYQKALDMIESVGYPYYEGEFNYKYARMLLEKGDLDRAMERAERARSIWSSIGSTDSLKMVDALLQNISSK